MKAGKVGILVIMISLAGMLGIGWFMSMDVVMTEKTVYNELTDITPLFGSEQAPEFTDYSPSTNYTGYYTDDSTIGGVKYFAGVDYDSSARANVYKLNLAPTATDNGTYTVASSDAGRWDVMYFPTASNMLTITSVNHLSLENLVTALGISGYTKFVMTNDSQPADWTTTDTFITFGTSDLLDKIFVPLGADHALTFKNPTLTGNLQTGNIFGDTIPAASVADPILALSYDNITGLVELFSDVDRTRSLGLYSPSDVYVIAGGTNASFIFGSDIDYLAMKFPTVTYMDPTKGVEMI